MYLVSVSLNTHINMHACAHPLCRHTQALTLLGLVKTVTLSAPECNLTVCSRKSASLIFHSFYLASCLLHTTRCDVEIRGLEESRG